MCWKKNITGGICIEANPESFEQLKRNRRVICVNACLDAGESFVTFVKSGMFGGIVSSDTDNKLNDRGSELLEIKTVTLEQLLKKLNAPTEIDYLSVDIEGAEERVLGGFPFDEYKFKCMTIERPANA